MYLGCKFDVGVLEIVYFTVKLHVNRLIQTDRQTVVSRILRRNVFKHFIVVVSDLQEMSK